MARMGAAVAGMAGKGSPAHGWAHRLHVAMQSAPCAPARAGPIPAVRAKGQCRPLTRVRALATPRPPPQEKAGGLERERAQTMFFQMQSGMMPQAAAMMAPMAGMGVMQQPGGGVMGLHGAPAMQAGAMQAAVMQQQQQPGCMAPSMARTPSGMLAVPQQVADMQQQVQQQPLPAPVQQQQQQQQQTEIQPAPSAQLDLQQQQQQQQQQQLLQQQAQPSGAPPALAAGGYMAPGVSDSKLGVAAAGGPMGAMPGAPMYWQSMVPHTMLDATQDSLLRPPAA